MARSQQPASLKMTFLFVFLLSLFSSLAPALQVTPNSPCAQFCLDSSDHDSSNHKSSSTHGDDIVCNDDEFASRSEGQKFQRCLSCLQDSTFKNGDENDQDWFLHNLRYSFDYCVFGYPNATGIGSSPCITSEACGPLEKALKKGITEPDDRKQYDYCDVDGKAMLGNSYGNCQACITVDSTRTIISNFLVALEAGCQQRPKPGATISLNDTVFSESSVGIVDPTASLAPEDSHSLPNSSIAGIAVGGFVFLLISAGCIFVQHRKRKNRSALNRRSSWSFRCQTHLTPRQPDFGPLDRDHFGRPYMDEENSPTRADPMEPPSPECHEWVTPAEDVSPTSSISSCSTTAPLLFNAPPGHQVASPGISSPLFSPGFSVASPRTPRTPRSGTFPPREQSDSNNPWLQERASGSGKGFFKKRDTRSFQAPTETRNIKIVFDPPPKRAR
ncbi:hypothetical protein NM208_g9939 [Fusarium decemcellulare]|uniref:Uncharacterized protein n=1 Tax=Fusarium decemcellulare TaxID=57161 RepID=A0ACC1RZU5_9HYPO|nr:hypothetical protein NM208_g9939 [Fusarium decemcellulare]